LYMSLYRKYRPSTFEEVIGQDHITTTLQNALSQDRLAHAYLFSGPRGTGKTTVARILASELHCSELDTIEIDAASHRGIDEVRALREQVQFQPSGGEKKIYILDEVHMLTKEAFNALLKMIEEPPAFVHFVLCTTEPHKVPITIISRTQRFDFKPGTVDSITSLLRSVAEKEQVEIEDAAIQVVASLANGGYRDAQSLFEQVMQSNTEGTITAENVRSVLGLVDDIEIERLVMAIMEKNFEQTKKQLEAFDERQLDWQYVSSSLLKQLRDQILSDEKTATTENLQLLSTLTVASRNIKFSPVPQIPIEVALIGWFREDVVTIQPAPKEQASAVEKQVPMPVKEKPRKPTTTPKPEQSAKSAPVIQRKEGTVHQLWPDILMAIKPFNHTLEALLKGCEPGDLANGVLSLNFKYKFHKEKIEEVQNKQIV
ncbi:DNA polymerase III subunit gamma/tau, partial [candidate division WWE3 bacterium]|nr:DNA polymerase III subunit gamma/tau [candidate division WWE3 bacterium]